MAGEDVVMHIPKFGIRGVFVVLGGFLVHLALGSYYMFGNYSPYIISYLRNRTSDTDVRNVDALWVTSFGNIGNIFGMVIGGILDRKYGPRIATGVGSLIYCSSVFVTYFCVQVNLDLVTFTYGFTGNFGNSCHEYVLNKQPVSLLIPGHTLTRHLHGIYKKGAAANVYGL